VFAVQGECSLIECRREGGGDPQRRQIVDLMPKLLLERLCLGLPAQPPPKISAAMIISATLV